MKTLRFLFIIAAISCSLILHGQREISYIIDSLQHKIENSLEDTNKVQLMIVLSRYYSRTEPQSAIRILEEGQILSEKLKYDQGMRGCLGMKGIVYTALGDYPKATTSLEKCLELSIAANNPTDIARASGSLGNVFLLQSRYPEALEKNFIALKAFEQADDSAHVAVTLNNIGTIHQELGNYDEALKWLEKSKKISEKIGIVEYLTNSLSNIATCEMELGKLDAALLHYEQARDMSIKFGDIHGQAVDTHNLGGIYFKKKEYNKAYDLFKESLRLYQTSDFSDGIANSYSSIANTMLALAQNLSDNELKKIKNLNFNQTLEKALIYQDSSILIHQELNDLSGLMNGHKIRSSILERQGRFEESLLSLQEYATFRDSIFHIEKENKIAQTSMQYEFDKKNEAARAEQEKKDIREKNIRNSIIAGLAAVMIFLIVVMYQRNKISKEKKRSEELLLNILPEVVANELKQKGEAEAVLIDEVTVLFTDFKGFTSMSVNMSPKELVRDLHECFSAFDKIMEKHRMEKIKTIGDAYMAAGGLPTTNTTHAADAVSAAIEMAEFIEEGRRKKTNDEASLLSDTYWSAYRSCSCGYSWSEKIPIRYLGRHREHRFANGKFR